MTETESPKKLTGRGGPGRSPGRNPLSEEEKKVRVVVWVKPRHVEAVKIFAQEIEVIEPPK